MCELTLEPISMSFARAPDDCRSIKASICRVPEYFFDMTVVPGCSGKLALKQ